MTEKFKLYSLRGAVMLVSSTKKAQTLSRRIDLGSSSKVNSAMDQDSPVRSRCIFISSLFPSFLFLFSSLFSLSLSLSFSLPLLRRLKEGFKLNFLVVGWGTLVRISGPFIFSFLVWYLPSRSHTDVPCTRNIDIFWYSESYRILEI